MYIESITLRNFRCHRNREFTFTTGINGIIGKNGAGKSSIIDAIRFAFTGELDDSKEQTITAGETDGWVRCVFVLNDKRGTIERSLSGSKVVLVYDGKRLNKATEVKELWAELLQIDGSIFNNVVIAKQGEIPLLFTGHDASRERIFQKIFLVPNTEKIRTILWDKYMKTCPAELIVEDIAFLQKQQAQLADQIKSRRRQEEDIQTRVLDDSTLTSVVGHVAYLRKCMVDRETRPLLERRKAAFETLMTNGFAQVEELKAIQKTIDIVQVKLKIDQLKASKLKQEAKISLTHKLAELEQEENKIDAGQIKAALEQKKVEYDRACEQRAIFGGRQQQAQQSIDRMKGLVGKEACPLCEQPIKDVSSFIKLLEEKVAAYNQSWLAFDLAATQIWEEMTGLQGTLYTLEARKGSIKQIRDQLAVLSSVSFYAPELSHQEAIVKDFEVREKKINEVQQLILGAQANVGTAKVELDNLANYEGQTTPEHEMSVMEQVIAVNNQRKEELGSIRLDLVRLETEYNTIDQRVAVSIANEEKNAKRNAYFAKLQQLYDLLHVSKFPRLLIESYREVVQDILLHHIQRFDIPYRPRITEGFKIELFNAEGRVIPSVSGGQKVIVGLCLRLALHSLFAQSFPMWIVDEGTTHLDDDNERQYFEMIRVLKTDSNIKQVIIIDHSDLLADAVDHIIRL